MPRLRSDAGTLPSWARGWPLLSLVVIPLLFWSFGQAVALRPEHLLIAALLMIGAWSPLGRSFSLLLALFSGVGMGYELFPMLGGLRNDILVDRFWKIEHLVFPAPWTAGKSLSDVVSSVSWAPIDFLTGLTYITYLPQVMILATWLFFRGDRFRAQRLAWGFVFVNLMGWAMWLLWPTAPPWYVDEYGLGAANLSAPASAAGAARFDALVGHPIFHDFYSRSTNVFGAFPSLHSSYAVLSAIVGFGCGGRIRAFTFGYAVVMCFAAVYLRHHYLVDVVAGIACALLADRMARSWMPFLAQAVSPAVVTLASGEQTR